MSDTEYQQTRIHTLGRVAQNIEFSAYLAQVDQCIARDDTSASGGGLLMAWPIPLDAPVIKITLPFKSKRFMLSHSCSYSDVANDGTQLQLVGQECRWSNGVADHGNASCLDVKKG